MMMTNLVKLLILSATALVCSDKIVTRLELRCDINCA
jgi:hypothetical protein